MFNKNFYPTPQKISKKMVEGLFDEWSDKYKKILEPSAGKGDILDYLEKELKVEKNNLFCIEKNYELSNILKNKGYNFISYDFLKYNSEETFDYIIMNPPFDNGAKHLLHAFNISKGAEIRCLLNSETLKNPCNRERQLLLELITEHGKTEDLGAVFLNSERKTNVNVTLVKLKNQKYKNSYEYKSNFKSSKEPKFEEITDFSLATKDNLLNMEIRFKRNIDITKQIISLLSQLDFYSKGLIENGAVGLLKKNLSTTRESFDSKSTFNKLLKDFKNNAWKEVFKKTNVSKYLTTKMRDNFYLYQEKQENMEFSKENIEMFITELFSNRDSIMQSCVEEQFDLLTKYHDENREYVEGWKTNDKWMVKRKVILPYMQDDIKWYGVPKLTYRGIDQLNDIEKAVCFITRKDYEKCETIEKVFKEKKVKEFGTWYNSENFKFKIFKKGTIHIEFREKKIYEEFNRVACKNKRWLKEA